MSTALDVQMPLPTGSLEAYVTAVNSVPILSVEKEKALATSFRETGDIDAARQLVLSHLRFVVRVARGYSGYGLQLGDLIQEGNIGLMKAVKRFDPTIGVRLVSFAVHWVRAEMHEYILRNWRIVKVATTKSQRKLFFNLRSSKKRLGWLNNEEVIAVAKDLKVAPKDVLLMEERLSAHDTAFDSNPADDDDQTPPAAYYSDMRFEPSQQLESLETDQTNKDQLLTALKQLDERSRDIVTQRWLAAPKKTLKELAKKYDISAERIRQIEKNAFVSIRNAMSGTLQLSNEP
ncbi:MAG TPA: RNA polymerase sigma factor RpoH [Gammaproteobacteria bacterium]|nr:RNA polymerase sigma factor RpoH [Gammaproteobacteria bacterium]|tara:strand:- start:549 stop:1418 length:870 start_codon:yes stop_codon:yes gene_type:complete